MFFDSRHGFSDFVDNTPSVVSITFANYYLKRKE